MITWWASRWDNWNNTHNDKRNSNSTDDHGHIRNRTLLLMREVTVLPCLYWMVDIIPCDLCRSWLTWFVSDKRWKEIRIIGNNDTNGKTYSNCNLGYPCQCHMDFTHRSPLKQRYVIIKISIYLYWLMNVVFDDQTSCSMRHAEVYGPYFSKTPKIWPFGWSICWIRCFISLYNKIITICISVRLKLCSHFAF